MALDSRPLGKMLDDVAAGHIQLPDFQREWKWDDEHIISILATVTMDYPMGVVMTLATGGPGGKFKTRPLQGVHPADGVKPEQLLLDGQQRMTALYQALKSGRPVDTVDQRDDPKNLWYYIHIETAIDPKADRESAIRSLPEDKIIKPLGRRAGLDLSTTGLEYERGYFPLWYLFDSEKIEEWQWGYTEGNPERRAAWIEFRKAVLMKVQGYSVPLIRLEKDTPRDAVCTVFEKVNTKGVQLTVFELLTATFAGDEEYTGEHGEFHLPDHWEATRDELVAAYPVLGGLQNTDFLQAVCLASTYHKEGVPISCKRRDMLDLELADYLAWAPKIADALHWAGEFLTDQCIFHAADLPYRTQLPPLAAIRTVLGRETDDPGARKKLARWYWCGVFGEQYGGTADSRFPRDVEQVVSWLRGGRAAPESIGEANFVRQRLLTMNSRNSAAYKGVFALLVQQGCVDWYYTDKPITGDQMADGTVDIHRIFPAAWCDKNNIASQRRDSVVNKTLLSGRAAKTLGKNAPSVGLELLERETGIRPNWLDDALLSHAIDPPLLRGNTFQDFFMMRMEKLLGLVFDAMGLTEAEPT